MEIIGKSTINPFLFISGKISGYLTWIFLIIELIDPQMEDNQLFPFVRYAFIVFLAGGIFFVIVSSIYLGKSVRLGLPGTATKLKTSGIYSISRNPMYVGLNMVTIAAMLYVFKPVVIITGLYSIILYHFIILGEEQFLEKRFKEKYYDYKKRTRRYL